MSGNPLKDAVKFILYKRRHPGVTVARGATLAGDNTFGRNNSFGKDVYVLQSKFGDNVSVRDNCRVFHSEFEGNSILYENGTLGHVSVGAYSYLSQSAQISHLSIGRFCSIGPGLKSGFGIHPTDFVSTSPVFFSTRKQCGTTFAQREHFTEYEQTKIGHDVWTGNDVYIKDGTTVGDGAILAAGAVVVRDVEPYAIVGGVPAKIIRFRFDERTIAELLRHEWWNWSEAELREAQAVFAVSGVEAFLDWSKTRGSLKVKTGNL
jgi:acetyltransferase-like isoleucine patch superfamily enzyme